MAPMAMTTEFAEERTCRLLAACRALVDGAKGLCPYPVSEVGDNGRLRHVVKVPEAVWREFEAVWIPMVEGDIAAATAEPAP